MCYKYKWLLGLSLSVLGTVFAGNNKPCVDACNDSEFPVGVYVPELGKGARPKTVNFAPSSESDWKVKQADAEEGEKWGEIICTFKYSESFAIGAHVASMETEAFGSGAPASAKHAYYKKSLVTSKHQFAVDVGVSREIKKLLDYTATAGWKGEWVKTTESGHTTDLVLSNAKCADKKVYIYQGYFSGSMALAGTVTIDAYSKIHTIWNPWTSVPERITTYYPSESEAIDKSDDFDGLKGSQAKGEVSSKCRENVL